LLDELRWSKNIKVILALGKIAADSVVTAIREMNLLEQKAMFKFSHGAELKIDEGKTIIASFHPSQQNTFTGRLTKPMFNKVFKRVKILLEH